jgi:hypothetical protein
MKRQRALVGFLVGLAGLVGTGALCAIAVTIAGGMGSSEGDTPVQASIRMVIAADQEGSLTLYAPATEQGAIGAHIQGRAADGSVVWDMAGVESGVTAGLPGAVVVQAAEVAPSAGEATRGIVRVGQDGRSQEVARSEGLVRLLWADSRETVYVETLWDDAGIAQSRIVTVGDRGTETTVLPGAGESEGLSVSADGLAVAVVTRSGGANQLAFYRREPGEPWRLVSWGAISAYYVALSADGNLAVLGYTPPALVEFGQREGRQLPVEYVAEARIGGSRLLVLDYRVVENLERTVVQVVDLGSNSIEWSREFDGCQRVASDADVSHLAYVAAGNGQVVVVDLANEAEREFSVPDAEDAGFIDSGRLLVVLGDGAVTNLAVGGAQ